MKLIALAATAALLVFGAAPAFAGGLHPCPTDVDSDGVFDCEDNCSTAANPAQDDVDGDDCGNRCDPDYNQNGTVGIPDFGQFAGLGLFMVSPPHDHTEPVGDVVGIPDFAQLASRLFGPPGPSGTSANTLACPN